MAKRSDSEKRWFLLWPGGAQDNFWEGESFATEAEAIKSAEETIVDNEDPSIVFYVAKASRKVSLAPKTEKVD